MNPSSDRVLRYLAGNDDIENIPINELQKLAYENPYFPVAQFLLAKKLKAGHHNGFLQQVQKTALYFSNTYWLHYQLSDGSWNDVLSGENNFAGEEIGNTASPANTELSENKETNEIPDKLPELEACNESGDIYSENEGIFPEGNTPGKQDTATEVLEEMAGVTPETDETIEAFLNDVQTTTEENSTQPLPTAISPFVSDVVQQNKSDDKAEPDEHERMFQNIKAMLDATSEEADADIEDAVIPIDPYYTIDYFASQGIKLELEQNPNDQLGQHLKKFTHWLKHMKKLGPEDAAEVIKRSDTDTDIQKIAKSSNTVREVVTEAMASVLEKQGKNDKAIELYKKLSFLNPDKSAYFAGKIKNLKGI